MERVALFNEVLALIGVLVFTHLLVIKQRIEKAHLPIIGFAVWGIFSFSIGYIENSEGTIYQKLRTTPFLYSIFCYFVGYYYLYRYSFHGLKNMSWLLVIGCLFGGKLAPALGVLLTSDSNSTYKKNINILLIFIFMLEMVNLMLGNHHGSSTLILIFFLVLIFRVSGDLPYKVIASNFFTFGILTIFIVFFVSLHLVFEEFQQFYNVGFSFFSGGDSNLLWRLMFWAKLVGEMSFYETLTGIKLATPLFNPLESSSAFIVASEPNALDRPYTLGPHNSFVYLFVRMGGIFFFCFLYFLLSLMKSLSVLGDLKSKLLIITLCVATISLSFNVFLETPLYAGIFWSLIGLCQRHLKFERYK
ncbi:hypothetical protein [Psychrosphaera haliotis]|uniref:O-antigen ligase domain-containing protein n=1 Tax=Psychrosphaera haliotis TaxID=555083 RepID=A0A6N8F5A3_9GAMM|nr:hypothetical protein [Psychrosphaera haliotis]MUH71344.1 hypothetical protein [Psychrosphaera haliotis]